MAGRKELVEVKEQEAESNPYRFYDAIILDYAENPTSLPCGHVFDEKNPGSLPALLAAAEKKGEDPCCPSCREPFKKAELLPMTKAWEIIRANFTHTSKAKEEAEDNFIRMGVQCRRLQRQFDSQQNTLAEKEICLFSLSEAYDQSQRDINALKTRVFEAEQELKKEKQQAELVSKQLLEQKKRANLLEIALKTSGEYLAEKEKALANIHSFTELKEEKKSASPFSTKRFLAAGSELKELFDIEKTIQKSATNITELKHQIHAIKNKMKENLILILAVNEKIKSAKEIKQRLDDKCKQDAKKAIEDITKLPDTKQVMVVINELHANFLREIKALDQNITALEEKKKQFEEAQTHAAITIGTLKNQIKDLKSSIKTSYANQLKELQQFRHQTKLYSLSFFHGRYKPKFDAWVERSKKAVASKKRA